MWCGTKLVQVEIREFIGGDIKGGGKATTGVSILKTKAITGLTVSSMYKPDHEHMPYFVFSYFWNKQKKVPKAILEMNEIIKLYSSNNFLTCFDEAPVFKDTMQELSLTGNSLRAPPSWICKEEPNKLKCLEFSSNSEVANVVKGQEKENHFTYCLDNYRILLVNCGLQKCKQFLYMLCGVKKHIFGGGDVTLYNGLNELNDFSLDGISCYGARIINPNNCQIYDIHDIITDYSLVAYVDLGANYIACLPEEFGYLTDLEICILSSNKLKNFPKININLKKLKILFLSNKKIEYLPDNLFSLPQPKYAELYDNCVDTLPIRFKNMEKFYASQPEQYDYNMRNKHTSYEWIFEKNIKPAVVSDLAGNSFETWDELPLDSDCQDGEFAEQLGFEYVTEQNCDVDNEAGDAESEDEFVLLG